MVIIFLSIFDVADRQAKWWHFSFWTADGVGGKGNFGCPLFLRCPEKSRTQSCSDAVLLGRSPVPGEIHFGEIPLDERVDCRYNV